MLLYIFYYKCNKYYLFSIDTSILYYFYVYTIYNITLFLCFLYIIAIMKEEREEEREKKWGAWRRSSFGEVVLKLFGIGKEAASKEIVARE